MIKIFISYRRQDSADVTGRIYDRLRDAFDKDGLFKDVDNIPFGVDFRVHLDHEVGQCDVMLAVIGRNWLNIADDNNKRRLEDPTDFVRIEIESALKRQIPVVPLLAHGISMPTADELPESIRELAFRNATQVRADPDFHKDMDRLISGIKKQFSDHDLDPPRDEEPQPDLSSYQQRLFTAKTTSELQQLESELNILGSKHPDNAEILELQQRVAFAITSEKDKSVPAFANKEAKLELPSSPSRFKPYAIAAIFLLSISVVGWWYLTSSNRDDISALTNEQAKQEVVAQRLKAEKEKAEALRLKAEKEKAEALQLKAEKEKAEALRLQAEKEKAAVAARNKPPSVFQDDFLDGTGKSPSMVVISAGSYLMGLPDSEANRSIHEVPQHTVTIASFAMGKYEVTFDEYDRFVEATGRRKPEDHGWGRENRPVINVSWKDASAYAEWLSQQTGKPYRLPSEAEWEYAARAGTTGRYALPAPHGSDDISNQNLAVCDGCGSQWDEQTAPVGQFKPNSWGLHDMHGNVLEWVQDSWHANYEKAPGDGSAWENPDDAQRVLRGGSWAYVPEAARSSNRFKFYPDFRYDHVGFRVVCSGPL